MRSKVVFPREVLLVEVERWCRDHACNARTRLSLTKDEARAYAGFECARCERWNDDALAERDIPEWWEQLKVASLEGLRPPRGAGVPSGGEAGGVVVRMSDAWMGLGAAGAAEDADAGAEAAEGGERF